MNIIVACRRRGSAVWSHHFRVEPWQWRSFRRHARMCRDTFEHCRVVGDNYIPVL